MTLVFVAKWRQIAMVERVEEFCKRLNGRCFLYWHD